MRTQMMTKQELEASKARHKHCEATMDEGDIWSSACDVPELIAEVERLEKDCATLTCEIKRGLDEQEQQAFNEKYLGEK